MRAEAGALSHMQGDIKVTARLPSPLSALKSSDLERSDGAADLHRNRDHQSRVLDGRLLPVRGRRRISILENGAYWASEGTVELRLHRERVWTSFWAGEGLIDYQTKVSGYGCVVLNAPGPVEEVTLKDERLMVEGKLVLARTEGLDYRMRRPTRSSSRCSPARRRCGPTRAPARRWSAGHPTGTGRSPR